MNPLIFQSIDWFCDKDFNNLTTFEKAYLSFESILSLISSSSIDELFQDFFAISLINFFKNSLWLLLLISISELFISLAISSNVVVCFISLISRGFLDSCHQ